MDDELKKRITDTLTTLDSYLSLAFYRGTGPNLWHADDRRTIEAAIFEARALTVELESEG